MAFSLVGAEVGLLATVGVGGSVAVGDGSAIAVGEDSAAAGAVGVGSESAFVPLNRLHAADSRMSGIMSMKGLRLRKCMVVVLVAFQNGCI